jgi:asparagine synthase (glutamine-hydrolysing)
MCGIIGVMCKSRAKVSRGTFNAWRDRLVHRGPDQGATFEDRGMYLGFRRLSIIDLTEAASQPMTSEDGRWTIVFNGEIYNYRELRVTLEGEGVCFQTESDTEVLLKLIARQGVAGLGRLNGMYAFAVYDSIERTVLLVRDRMGVKPLYYLNNSQTLAFSSEIRAIKDVPGFPAVLDEFALGIYFRVGMVPDWTSVFPGVRKLPPGTWIRFNLNNPDQPEPIRYWDLPEVSEDYNRNENDWVDEIDATLLDATRLRLRADVPVGVFLSGGIDSGLIAAAAARFAPGLSCFSIGFPGESEDESRLASSTASHLGLNLVKRDIDLQKGMSELPTVMGHFDEPLADLSALPTALICEEARKNLIVVLSGDAGDEVFAGYRNHVRARQWRHFDQLPIWAKMITSVALEKMTVNESGPHRLARRMSQPVGRFGVGTMIYAFGKWQNAVMRPSFICSEQETIRRYNQFLPPWDNASELDQAQRTDIRSYLLDDILVKVDRMSMRNSIEVRSPFLDYRMVELGLRIPSHLRVRNGQNKYLLRRLAQRYLPCEVANGPKRGFGIPFKSWIRNPGISKVLQGQLATPYEGFPEPFVSGGAEKLWLQAVNDRSNNNHIIKMLTYRWWCAAEGCR